MGVVLLTLVLILIAAMGVGIGYLSVTSSNRRRAALGVTIRDMSTAVASRTDDGPEARIRDNALSLYSEDVAASRIAADMRSIWIVAPSALTPAGQRPLDRVGAMLQALDANSLALAGTEQVLLNLLAPAHPDPVALSLAIQHLGNVLPADVHLAANEIFQYIHSNNFSESVHIASQGLLSHAAENLLKHGPQVLTAAAEENVSGVLLTVGKSVGEAAISPLAHIGHDAIQNPLVLDATTHLVHVGSALEAVNLADGVTSHIPIFTMLISGAREARLLTDGKATVTSSVKNFTLDMAGTGGGALTGGKLGALFGTMLAPGPGTVIGAAVGAALGGIGGRLTSNELKLHRLRSLVDELNRQEQEYPDQLLKLEAALSDAVVEKAAEYRQLYLSDVREPPRLMEAEGDAVRAIAIDLEVAARAQFSRGREIVAAASRDPQLRNELGSELAVLSGALTAAQQAISSGRQHQAEGNWLGSLITLASAPPPISADPRAPDRAKWLAAKAQLDSLAQSQRVATTNWTANAATLFRRRYAQFGESVQGDVEQYRSACVAAADAVKAAAAAVTVERDKLGLQTA